MNKIKIESNIFLGLSAKSKLARRFYDKLMKGEPVNYDILLNVTANSEKVSINPFYKECKKAVSDVVYLLEERVGKGCVEKQKGKGPKIANYKYIGGITDPLRKERQAYNRVTVELYEDFCRSTIGLVPEAWFSKFFENTILSLETKQDIENETNRISATEFELKNIELLPKLFDYIQNKQVIKFKYFPFGKKPYNMILHPHYLKEYNGRWFLFGSSYNKKNEFQMTNVAIDRISKRITILEDIEYHEENLQFYLKYLESRVGVSKHRENRCSKETILIRTYTKYMHDLMMSKKIHKSQQESLPFEEHNGKEYGEITLLVEWNKELIGRILTFGEELEIISPPILRNEIASSIKKMAVLYQK